VIFTSLGLLVLALALLVTGIVKSSVAFLMLSLLATVAAAALLALTYSVARRTGLTTGALPTPAPAMGAPPGGGPGTATVVMYVPVDQLPVMAPAAAAMRVATSGNGNGAGANGAGAPIAGYDDMTAEQVGKLVGSGALSEAQLHSLRLYEAAHAGRRRVIDRIDRVLGQQA
jgi:hypothetical protein